MLESLTSLGTGVAAFCACLILRAALEWHYAATRAHPAGCICRQHRKRDPKVVGVGRKKRRSANG